MNAFADAMDAIFTDPNLSAEATWTSQSGASKTVRVILSAPDATTNFGDSRFVSDSAVVRVRVADVAKPERGDTIVIDGDTLQVSAAPTRDRNRLVWKVEADPR